MTSAKTASIMIDRVVAATAGITLAVVIYAGLSKRPVQGAVMVPMDPQRHIDDAFDRIEGTILPCIGMILETMIDVAESGVDGAAPQATAAELKTLALQLEALTLEIERVSPARPDARTYRSAAA